MGNKKLICIVGPTASGKTALSIEAALHYQSEIISCDSRQFYREMNIGTAKPSDEELAAVPHHFINQLSIRDKYTAGIYEKEVIAFLNDFYKEKDIAFLVGGSGLFMKAVCEGFDEFTEKADEENKHIIDEVRSWNLEKLQQALQVADPEYFQEVDKLNPRRLMRALEVIYTTGNKYSAQRKGTIKKREFDVLKVGIWLPKDELNKRINERVDKMVAQGLVEEAESLYLFKKLKPMETVGYQELFDYLDGTFTLEQAIEKIKTNTRQYAKRQMTWFKRDAGIHWIKPEMNELTSCIDRFLHL